MNKKNRVNTSEKIVKLNNKVFQKTMRYI